MANDMYTPPGQGEIETGRLVGPGGKTIYTKEQAPTKTNIPQFQKRQEWEQYQYKKYGNPWEDEKRMSSMVSSKSFEQEEELFTHVFGDEYRYEDRFKMNKKDISLWEDSKLKLNALVEREVKGDITKRKAEHGQRMGVYDDYVKTFFKGTPVKVRGPQGKTRFMPPAMATGMEAATTGKEPSVAREKWDLKQSKEGLTSELIRGKFGPMTEEGLDLSDVDPEKYKEIEKKAAEFGLRPVEQKTEAEEGGMFGIGAKKESYNIIDFEPIDGDQDTQKVTKRKEGETISDYLKRVGE